MSAGHIRFDDGEFYERSMGRWSRLTGEVFLDWLGPPPSLRWADVGCGNGAFTDLLFSRADAAHVEGVDPSPGKLEFARKRLHGRSTELHIGTVAQLPFADAAFDAAVMALVIFFVPTPEAGRLRDAVQDKLRPGANGRVRCRARANAVAGTKSH